MTRRAGTRRLVLGGLLLLLAACADREADDLVQRLQTRDLDELHDVTGRLARTPNAIAVPALRRGLRAEAWRTRYMSAQLLGRFMEPAAVPDLLASLADSVGGVRAQAATALGSLQARAAVPALIERLDDDDPAVPAAAAGALGRLGAAAALPSLLRLSHDPDVTTRAAAVTALGPCHDDDAAPALSRQAWERSRQALGDVFVQVRIAGIVSLQAFAYRGAVDDLLRCLHDPAPEVQHVAVQALGEIPGVDAPAWDGDPHPDMGRVTTALDSIAAATTNPTIRARAQAALAAIAARSDAP